MSTQALSGPISSLSLLLVQTQAAKWKAAGTEQLTGAHLYIDIAKVRLHLSWVFLWYESFQQTWIITCIYFSNPCECFTGRHGVSNHRRLDCLSNHLFRRISKKTSKVRVTGLCEGNPPVATGFPSQRASNAENVSIWWRLNVLMRVIIIKWWTNKLLKTMSLCAIYMEIIL